MFYPNTRLSHMSFEQYVLPKCHTWRSGIKSAKARGMGESADAEVS
jgi:hypothetical protein